MIEQTATAVPEIEGAATLPDQLDDVLGALSAAAIDGLSEADLLDVITTLEATKGAAAALQARATARFVEDRDHLAQEAVVREEISRRDASCRRSATRAEVALARRCSPWQADRHVGAAKTLVHDLPMTMSALSVGEISESRALIVARETACLSRAHRIEADRRLAGDLSTSGDRALTAAAQRVCIDLDQEAIVERRRRAAGSRHVGVRPAPDGMARLSILGPLADVVGAYAALTAAEQARYVATGDPEVDAARAVDERGRGAWLADTALERLSGRDEGQVQPVEVGLVMREDAVVPRAGARTGRPGDAEELADEVEIPGWGSVPGDMAREHLLRLCDTGTETWLRRLWTAPGGRDLVAMDSSRRLFSGVLRQLIGLRDAVCRVPWCDAPARQVDHVIPFARGGATSAANAMGDCQRHNLVKEEPGWRAEVISTGLDPGGGRPHTVRVTTPTGSQFTSVAAPLLGHGRASPGRARSPMEIHYEGLLAA
ncbi:HNH endonuclease signature motif containing protein [Janibacter sp. DB-40]|uniref:HNH endonuclease signature motif containing protein n=1 Tax=Janibacter sp. DB-40 TaxID=3028808 RepID=UPI002404C65D|nr:HNH endonuclease signature motif containing protein [Janibacter sp. DB-40]